MKRFLALFLSVLFLLFCGCADFSAEDAAAAIEIAGEVIAALEEEGAESEFELEPQSKEEKEEAPLPIDPPAVAEDGAYYDKESVVLYLDAYGKLPPNFITKDEARALGWEGGSVEDYKEGAAIGGDRFGNREGLLPKAQGRTYTECDIDTKGYHSRGARRLVFSNDGLYFYTHDHYESFVELYVDENGEVQEK